MIADRQDLDIRLHRVAAYLAATRRPHTDQITATLAITTTPDPARGVNIRTLHAAYLQRCHAAGDEPLKLGAFSNSLKARGYQIVSDANGNAYVYGIRQR